MNVESDGAARYREQVVGALTATSILSATRFSWYDDSSGGLPRAVASAITRETARAHLLASLATRLYTNLYCPGVATPTGPDPYRSTASNHSSFVAALSAANAGAGCWEE